MLRRRRERDLVTPPPCLRAPYRVHTPARALQLPNTRMLTASRSTALPKGNLTLQKGQQFNQTSFQTGGPSELSRGARRDHRPGIGVPPAPQMVAAEAHILTFNHEIL